jgi:hypothetical protein
MGVTVARWWSRLSPRLARVSAVIRAQGLAAAKSCILDQLLHAASAPCEHSPHPQGRRRRQAPETARKPPTAADCTRTYNPVPAIETSCREPHSNRVIV